MSVPEFVVKVIPLPAANVKVSVELSAITLFCPDTAMFVNAFPPPPPPPAGVVQLSPPLPSVVSTWFVSPSLLGNVKVYVAASL